MVTKKEIEKLKKAYENAYAALEKARREDDDAWNAVLKVQATYEKISQKYAEAFSAFIEAKFAYEKA